MQLSKNFTLKEMCKSSMALRLDIDNTPNEKEIQNLIYLTENISQPCRDRFGRINVNSGFRCKKLNDAVGSTDASFHKIGCAEDIEAELYSNLELLVYIHENLPYTELIAEHFDKEDGEAGWVHAAIQKDNPKKTLKLKDKDHHYKVVTIDYIKKLYS